jgi:hypothetical protein
LGSASPTVGLKGVGFEHIRGETDHGKSGDPFDLK